MNPGPVIVQNTLLEYGVISTPRKSIIRSPVINHLRVNSLILQNKLISVNLYDQR